MSRIRKAKEVYQNEGLVSLARKTAQHFAGEYLYLRRYITDGMFVRRGIPSKVGVFNGVYVKNVAFFESRLQDRNYEEHLVYPLRLLVEPADDVTIVGGGMGVSTVIAAQQVGNSGRITTYEGARKSVEMCRLTTQLNGVDQNTSVHHAIVGTAVGMSNEPRGAEEIDPAELQECDVLSLDCDGAEIEILKGLEIRPRVLNVEHHSVDFAGFEEQHDRVVGLIEDLGYNLVETDDLPYESDTSDIVIYSAIHDDFPLPEWCE